MIEIAKHTIRQTKGPNPVLMATLAAAYAESKQFPEAVQTAREALELARNQNDPDSISSIQAAIVQYQSGNPFREPAFPTKTIEPHPMQPERGSAGK